MALRDNRRAQERRPMAGEMILTSRRRCSCYLREIVEIKQLDLTHPRSWGPLLSLTPWLLPLCLGRGRVGKLVLRRK